jgi:hypothetical protein
VLAECPGSEFWILVCIRGGAGVEEVDGENLESSQPTELNEVECARKGVAKSIAPRRLQLTILTAYGESCLVCVNSMARARE